MMECVKIVEVCPRLSCNESYYRSCYEPDLHTGPFLAERCSHSACYHAGKKAMYIFGGCTATYTAFNDLWTFDLVSCALHIYTDMLSSFITKFPIYK